jgi:N-acetylglucosaminyldiphosphoundecaprenol N-acetyl-beta-D-mannosaminyltransferase
MSLPTLRSCRILETFIHATSYQDACDRIVHWLSVDKYGYIVAANVHVVMTGHWQPDYQKILNRALLVTPDGMPLVWGLRLLGIKKQTRVYGPDLMLACCARAENAKIPIFLYGATTDTLWKLEKNLRNLYPDLIIAGTLAPPFYQLTAQKEAEFRQKISASGAKIVMVGLGCPKQEEWMSRQQGKLDAILLGVGAAFSFHAQEVSQAPRWVMNMGLEWFYRLLVEPRRLWRRYLINNPAFLLLFTGQLLRRCFWQQSES